MGTRKTHKTHIVSWYGPFHSIEEIEEWQYEHQNMDFCLYLIQGKKPYARTYSYYCGQTRRPVTQRFNDRDHHINEIPNCRNIWIGSFENRYTKTDIDVVENMFIHILSFFINDSQLLNKRDKALNKVIKYTKGNVFLISKWNNINRQPEYSIKLQLPEIAAYFVETGEVKFARKLRLHSL